MGIPVFKVHITQNSKGPAAKSQPPAPNLQSVTPDSQPRSPIPNAPRNVPESIEVFQEGN